MTDGADAGVMRHPREGGDPEDPASPHWMPAFAGMTDGADAAVMRHPREGGDPQDPASPHWMPAFAGMTDGADAGLRARNVGVYFAMRAQRSESPTSVDTRLGLRPSMRMM
jgi:hypothetical protein